MNAHLRGRAGNLGKGRGPGMGDCGRRVEMAAEVRIEGKKYITMQMQLNER